MRFLAFFSEKKTGEHFQGVIDIQNTTNT